jgi:D-3-phosphoglycerate dehydrogenase
VDKVHPYLVAQFTSRGFLCETVLQISYNEFIELKNEYEGLIIRSKFNVDKNALLSKNNLKFIIRIGSGVEHIDIQFAEAQGIRVISTPEGNAPAVAEHCLGMLLAALKKIATANDEVKNGEWFREKNKGVELSSQTVGIIGFGNTGKAFAKLLNAFGCKILVYDKFKTGFTESYIKEVSLEELLQQATVISLHVNYLPENHYFVNKSLLQKTKQQPVFINTSRGLAVNTADLIFALDEDFISFACLDVLEYENVNLQIPPKTAWNETLWRLTANKKVLLTPHTAGQTLNAELRHAEVAVEKIFSIALTQNSFPDKPFSRTRLRRVLRLFRF